jgi:hypothetical protein
LHKLPRAETRTTDLHDPGKVIVYSGTPLVEVLKAGGLRLESGMAGIRETVTITALVEATDGYRAVFALAELDSELTDRVILLLSRHQRWPTAATPRGTLPRHRSRRKTHCALGASSQSGDSLQKLKTAAGSAGWPQRDCAL